MKYFIVTDLEGPAGVNQWCQTREGANPENLAAKHLLTGEVNAAVEGLLETDADAEIIVWDGHGSGGLIFEMIHPDARVVMHGQGMGAPHHLDSSFDAFLFVGQHAMAGTPDAPLCHTYSSRNVEYYMLNGELIGEIGCLALMAGAFDIPVIFLAGDDKACAEARALIPGIATVETKKGLGIELALHLSHERARSNIRKGAACATRVLAAIKPLVLQPPFELEIRVLEGCDIAGYLRPGDEAIDAQTVLRRSDDLIGLFRR